MVTLEGEEFLKKLEIIEVSETHESKQLHTIDTEKIPLDHLNRREEEKREVKIKLFDVMYDLKKLKQCRFEFGLNSIAQNEIVMICR